MSARSGLPLGRVAGVPVRLAPSWALIALFLVVAFGPQVARVLPGLGLGAYVVALAYALLLALSVLVHEVAHALVGRATGQRAEEIVLTLWGGHTQFRGIHAGPGGTVATAMAGPAANVVVAGLAWAAGQLVPAGGVAALLLETTVGANLLLAAFNALPGLPLDGGRMVESAVWAVTGSRDRGTQAAGWAGRVLVVALVAVAVGGPLLQGRRPELLPTLLLVGVAAILWRGASEAVERGAWGRRLAGVRLDALELPAVGVPLRASVAGALAGRSATAATVAVDDAGRPVGVVDLAVAGRLGPAEAAATSVAAVCRAVPPHAVLVRADLPAGGPDLVAALLAPEEPGAGDPPSPLAETGVWVLTDARGAVHSAVPRESVLAAMSASRHPRP